MSFHTLDEAYGMIRALETYRESPDSRLPSFDYRVRGAFTTEDGEEYSFVHSHNAGRPLPRRREDCPHQGSEIDPVSGECMDICKTDNNCGLGYHCKGSFCVRDTCKDDNDCSEMGDAKKCLKEKNQSQGFCQLLTCDNALFDIPHNVQVSNSDIHTFIPASKKGNDRCIQTSHYNLKARGVLGQTLDDRYNAMY